MPDHRKIKNVTLRDVAKRAGVSAMTVSRALAGKDNLVNPETAEHCRRVADEMGYVPNLLARSLRGEQLNTIVMFAEFISSHHYLAELVDVVSRSIEHRRYGVISCQSIGSLRQALKNFQLAGAVVIAPPESFFVNPFGQNTPRTGRDEPIVLIHSAITQDEYNEVSPDIAGFTQQAASHLLELGHRHLGYLGGARLEDEPRWFDLRRNSIRRALTEHGVSPANLWYQACPDAELAPAALQQLLMRAPQTTGVMCLNDEIAIASVVGARKIGRRVPRDLSVVGCNDINLAGFFEPALTTFSIDIRSMVETALDMLFDEIRSPKHVVRKPITIKLPARLIVRDSTAPPPSA